MQHCAPRMSRPCQVSPVFFWPLFIGSEASRIALESRERAKQLVKKPGCLAQMVPKPVIASSHEPTKLGTSLGTEPCQTPLKTDLQHARKCKKSQLLRFSGEISGFQVEVLGGSPLLAKLLIQLTITRLPFGLGSTWNRFGSKIAPTFSRAIR